MLKKAWDTIDDLVTIAISKTGLHELDSALRKNMGRTSVTDFMDKAGISNKSFLKRYNQRHPENPLPFPYQN